MTNLLAHRGPDASGIWDDEKDRCSLGHRRLSIIDTSDAGKQPMLSADERWIVSFNGELYNFQELRAELQAAGIAFRGRTDTEVLIHSIALWGVNALPKFEGMFAFAAFDRASGQLILARDPFGEKPLYYAELPGGGIAFASELQSIERLRGIDLSVSVDSIAELLMFQYIGAPRTIYQSVRKLPPGHWLSCYPGQAHRIGSYFSFDPGKTGFDERPIGELADELEDILVRSLRRRLISDVPLGAFLSGGVDSSTVCALITKRMGVPLKTFSIGFENAPESEHQAARDFAEHLGTDHHEKLLTPHTSEFLVGIGKVLDEPNGDSSCLPTYLLSAFARESVTVALSGDGGDEMFAGYGRYFATLDDAARRSPSDGWRAGDAYYSNRILVSVEEHVHELLGHVPEGSMAHLTRLRDEVSSAERLYCALRETDVKNYMPGAVLPKVDRMSMQHSLEVRTPFLNVELAGFAERLPLGVLYDGTYGKRVLREIAYRYLPRKLIDLPKQGFGLPMSQWAKTSLLNVAAQLLESEESRLREALGEAPIGRFMARQRSPNGFAAYQVWTLAMLESWLRHHPARLTRLDTMPPSTTSRRKVEQAPAMVAPSDENRPFLLWPMREGFVVLTDARVLLDAPLTDPAASSALAETVHLMQACGQPLAPASSVAPVEVVLNELGSGRDSAQAARLVRNATLLCLDHSIWSRLEFEDLERLRKAGAKKLVTRHPHRGDGAIFVLSMKSPGRWKQFWDTRTLTKESPRRRKVRSAHAVEGKLRVAGPLLGLPAEERELGDRYALFDGYRQLPPIPATHDEIKQLGGGRYSIWSRHAFFSRIGTALDAVWCVDIDEETAPLLTYVPEIVKAHETGGFEDFTARLGAYASAPADATPIQAGERIVVLTHALPPGGAERQWCYLAVELKRRGFDVQFVTLFPLDGQNEHYLDTLVSAGIPVNRLDRQTAIDVLQNLPDDPKAVELATHPANPFGIRLAELTSLLNRLRPRAVFAQLDFPNLIAASACVLASVPDVILSFRNYNPSNFSYLANEWFQPLYSALAKSPRVALTGNSSAANSDYASWIGIDEKGIVLVPNAIDATALHRPDESRRLKVRRELGLPDGAPVVLGIFRLNEEKRPLLFAESIARVAAEVPGVRALIAGVGPHEPALRQRISELGIGDRLKLLGRRDDVFDLMSISSVLLLTSKFEGMPNVVMEAQLCGIPVVAPRVGGVPDCVIDWCTGVIVDADDEAGFASACAALLKDDVMRARMGVQAHSHMTQFFSIEAMAARYLDVLARTPYSGGLA